MADQEQQEDFSKLPIEALIEHKKWDARKLGYEKAATLFAQLDRKDPKFSPYLGQIKTFAAESNVNALEKALEALLVFLENAVAAPKTAGEVCPVLVAKCAGHLKQKIREKATECLLMYIEIEKADIVMESLIEGLAHKNPKIVKGCAAVITEAVSCFGARAVGVKPVLGVLGGLLEHKDGDVRNSAKLLATQLHRWIGDPIKTQIANVKPVTLTELEEEFANSSADGRPTPTRYLRSQKPAANAMPSAAGQPAAAASTANAAAVHNGAAAAPDDPWEYLDPFNILAAVPANLSEQLEAKKWTERKEPLDNLNKLIEANPKLDPKGQYGELVSMCKRVIAKDSNINVIVSAANVMTGLATGLRTKFAPFAKDVLSVLVEKFKEKKANVVSALDACIDAVAKTTSLDSMLDELVGAFDKPSPSVRVRVALFLSRYVRKLNQASLKKSHMKALAAPLSKALSGSDPEVRDASAAAIAACMRAIGEKAVLPFFPELAQDNLKMQKVQSMLEEINNESTPDQVASMVASVHKSNAPAGENAAPPQSKGALAAKTMANRKPSPGPGNKPIAKPAQGSKTGHAAPSSKPASASSKPAVAAGGTAAAQAAKIREPPEPVGDRGTSITVPGEDPDGFNALPIDELCVHKAALIDGTQQKNPKLVKECANVCTHLVSCFGARAVGVKPVLGVLGGLLEHKDGDVRNSAKLLATQLHRWIGDPIKTQIANVKPVTLSELEADFAANSALGPPQATRQIRTAQPAATGGGGQQKAAAAAADADQDQPAAPQEDDPWDYLDAADILSKVPPNLEEMLESKKWTERKEPLDALSANLTSAPKLDPKGHYGDLATTLSKVLAKDNNINVAAVAAKCLTGLAIGLRTKFQPFSKDVLSVTIEKFKEKKPILVTELEQLIDAVAKTTSLDSMLDELVGAFDKPSPSVRVRVALFLSRYVRKLNQASLKKSHMKALAAPLSKALSGSDPEVRDASAAAIAACMRAIGEKAVLPFFPELAQDNLKMQKVRETYEKILAECPMEEIESMVASVHKANIAPPAAVRDPSPAPAAAAAAGSASSTASTVRKPVGKDPGAKGKVAAGAARTASSTRAKPGAAASNSQTGSKAADKSGDADVNTSFEGAPLIEAAGNGKAQRIADEKSLKSLKWNFAVPGEEHVEQLKGQMAVCCKASVLGQLFHPDFKMHLKALDTLSSNLEACSSAAVSCSDLLLKYATLRYFDTNPSVLLKCLELIANLLSLMRDADCELSDHEVASFIPYHLLKLGDPKDVVRKQCRDILARVYELYPASKVYPLLMDGTKSKNSRQKAECLDQGPGLPQAGQLIELHGPAVAGQIQPALRAIALCIGERDKDVRNAALNALLAAYMHMGERVYKICNNINAKDMAMLEERIKRQGKRGPSQMLGSKASTPAGRATPVVRGRTPASQAAGENAAAAGNDANHAPAADKENVELPSLLRKPKPSRFAMDVDRDLPPAPPEVPKPDLKDMSEVIAMMREPVRYPVIKSRLSGAPASASSVRRAGSLTSVTSMDASVALDGVIGQVHSNTLQTAMQAVQQLDELVKDPTKAHLLGGKIDQLLAALYFQLRLVFNTHMAGDGDPADVTRLYQSLCAMLLSLLSREDLARQASDGALKDLICQLITVLLDPRVSDLPDGQQIVRSINVLTVKLVERAEPTAVLVALIGLLRETLRSVTASPKFQELVLKCMWKVCRGLPSVLGQLHVSRVLFAAHQFFLEFPVETWQSRDSDMPLRTIKTILNTLAEHMGDQILDHCGSINEPHKSEVVAYVRKSLRVHARTKEEKGGEQLPGQVPSQDATGSGGGALATTEHTTHLSNLFKRIGDRHTSKEALSDLCAFHRQHPDVSLEPWLRNASDHLRGYVQRALTAAPPAAVARPQQQSEPAAGTYESAETIRLFKELQEMRAKAGLPPLQRDIKPPPSDDEYISRLERDATALSTGAGDAAARQQETDENDARQQQPRRPAADLTDLRRRLDMIKRGNTGV